jgi:DNA recombination protein RmuC
LVLSFVGFGYTLTRKRFWGKFLAMTQTSFNLFLTGLILILIIFILVFLNRIIKNHLKTIKRDLKNDLVMQLLGNKQEIVEKLGQYSGLQIGNIVETKNLISNNIQAQFQELESAQKLAFLDLKNQSQNSLLELQKTITQNLAEAIRNLTFVTNQNFQNLRQINEEKLDQINSQVNERLDKSFSQHLKSFEEVTKNIGQVQSLARQMVDSTSSIDKLNNIFGRTSSKSFGDFGEKYLESLLSENLSSTSWARQVCVPNSMEKIDFIVQIQDKKIGIDSKFPLTKYQDYLDAPNVSKPLAKREFLSSIIKMAEDISKKYGRAGFVDYLFLYLPSDSMYTLVADDQETVQKLQKKLITPISPITIFPVIMGIKSYQYHENINSNAENIIKGLGIINKNIASFQDEFRLLGDKLSQAQNNYESANKKLFIVSREIRSLDNQES